jgi:hypothetical protein
MAFFMAVLACGLRLVARLANFHLLLRAQALKIDVQQLILTVRQITT